MGNHRFNELQTYDLWTVTETAGFTFSFDNY